MFVRGGRAAYTFADMDLFRLNNTPAWKFSTAVARRSQFLMHRRIAWGARGTPIDAQISGTVLEYHVAGEPV